MRAVVPDERVLVALPAPGSVAALQGHAAGNGNAAVEARVAPLAGDSDLVSTAAGKWAAGQAPGWSRGSIYSNRFSDFPNHGPSDHPNEAAHQSAIRESMQGAGGSSAREFSG